jgi:hypothetical protein
MAAHGLLDNLEDIKGKTNMLGLVENYMDGVR